MFDPLDGSSNIDVNASIGTIFSIHRKITGHTQTELSKTACKKASEQMAAGYFIYGSSTMMVYTTGHGVNGFTLDPSLGEFLLSHENIRTPTRGKIYSINEGNVNQWDAGTRRYIEHVKKDEQGRRTPLFAALHRITGRRLPSKSSEGRNLPVSGTERKAAAALRSRASGDGRGAGRRRRIHRQPANSRHRSPTSLHQRVPLIIGSKEDVKLYEKFYREPRLRRLRKP